MKTLEQAIQEAYEKGWIEDPDDPWADLDCYGTVDPQTNQLYNCEECPLEAHCREAWDEAQSGVVMMDEGQIRAICQALAYSIRDTFDESQVQHRVKGVKEILIRNFITEFWNALNRNAKYRDQQIANGLVDKAIQHTYDWLSWFREGGLVEAWEIPIPEW